MRATLLLGLATALACVGAAPAQAQSNGDLDLRWSTIDGGSGRAVAGDVVLRGTAGQPDAGSATAAGLHLNAGFWPARGSGASTTPTRTITATRTPSVTTTSTPAPTSATSPSPPMSTPTAIASATAATPTSAPPATPTATPPATAPATATATPTPTSTPTPSGPLPGDANCDGRISAADLPALVIALSDGAPMCGADANLDGTVDDDDLDALVALLFAP